MDSNSAKMLRPRGWAGGSRRKKAKSNAKQTQSRRIDITGKPKGTFASKIAIESEEDEEQERFYHFEFPSSIPPRFVRETGTDGSSLSALGRSLSKHVTGGKITHSRPKSPHKISLSRETKTRDKPPSGDKPSPGGRPSYAEKPLSADKPSSGDKPSSTSKPLSADKPSGDGEKKSTDELTEPDMFLGKGEYGTVVSLRSKKTRQPTGQIMKVSLFRNERDERTFNREVYYLVRLQEIQWSRERLGEEKDKPTRGSNETKSSVSPLENSVFEASSPDECKSSSDSSRLIPHGWLVPRLYSYWKDNIEQRRRRPRADAASNSTTILTSPASAPVPVMQGIQIMEQFEGTVTDLGLIQAKRFRLKRAVALTAQQICSVVGCVHAYDRVKIVHGDLKRRNLLYSRKGQDIRGGDHGFTGFLMTAIETHRLRKANPNKSISAPPLTHPKIGYPREMGKWVHRFPTHLWEYLNRWQMYFDFVYVLAPCTFRYAACSHSRMWMIDWEGSYNRLTYVFDENSNSGMTLYKLPEPLIRKMLNVPLDIVYEFDSMVRDELLKNPDRKFVPDLPPRSIPAQLSTKQTIRPTGKKKSLRRPKTK